MFEGRIASVCAAVLSIVLPAGGSAASPTPNLKTGNYGGQRAVVIVGEPTQYGGDGVAVARHATTVQYNATTQTYVLHDYDGDAGYSFSPSEIVASKSNAAYTFYRDAATGSTLKLLNQGPANPVIALSYLSYGLWNIPKAPGETYIFADNYVVFGQKTPAASIPRSGSGSYNAVLDGSYHRGSDSYRLSGSAKYTANFGNATMSVSATPVATHLTNGSQLQFGTLNGGGYIYVNGSPMDPSYSFTAITPYVGTTRYASYGNFYGPQANEIGGVFTLKSSVGGSPGEGAGVFVGKHD